MLLWQKNKKERETELRVPIHDTTDTLISI